MTTYELPPEPDGPLYDKKGEPWRQNFWDRHSGEVAWVGPNREIRAWQNLLLLNGPLTDEPPARPHPLGAEEVAEELMKMADVSVYPIDRMYLRRAAALLREDDQ